MLFETFILDENGRKLQDHGRVVILAWELISSNLRLSYDVIKVLLTVCCIKKLLIYSVKLNAEN